jgi:DNA/RNA endonuclease YhcR with UshA esterase domain
VSHVGEHITVCGVVSGVSYRPDVNGQPTFINFDRPFPNHTFTALVWGDRRASFNPPPEVRFSEGTMVCVDGVIELYQGTPEIVVDGPSQISAC